MPFVHSFIWNLAFSGRHRTRHLCVFIPQKWQTFSMLTGTPPRISNREMLSGKLFTNLRPHTCLTYIRRTPKIPTDLENSILGCQKPLEKNTLPTTMLLLSGTTSTHIPLCVVMCGKVFESFGLSIFSWN